MGSKYRSDNNINNIIIIGNAKKCLSIYISFRYNAHLAEQRTDKKKKKNTNDIRSAAVRSKSHVVESRVYLYNVIDCMYIHTFT